LTDYIFARIFTRVVEGVYMQKKLTITVDERVYQGLYNNIGEGKISKFIETLIKPYVLNQELEYKNIAANEKEEQEAYEWIEGCIGDIYETR
jgi:predicted CopG family antitoxin